MSMIEELEIVNVVYKGKIDKRVNINKLVLQDYEDFDISYDPENFPGAMIKPAYHPKIKNILLFSSGSFIINANKPVSKEEVEEILKKILEEVM